MAILHAQIAHPGPLRGANATLSFDGTPIDVTTRAVAKVNRDDLRLLVGKAAQARRGGVVTKDAAPASVMVERVALL